MAQAIPDPDLLGSRDPPVSAFLVTGTPGFETSVTVPGYRNYSQGGQHYTERTTTRSIGDGTFLCGQRHQYAERHIFSDVLIPEPSSPLTVDSASSAGMSQGCHVHAFVHERVRLQGWQCGSVGEHCLAFRRPGLNPYSSASSDEQLEARGRLLKDR